MALSIVPFTGGSLPSLQSTQSMIDDLLGNDEGDGAPAAVGTLTMSDLEGFAGAGLGAALSGVAAAHLNAQARLIVGATAAVYAAATSQRVLLRIAEGFLAPLLADAALEAYAPSKSEPMAPRAVPMPSTNNGVSR